MRNLKKFLALVLTMMMALSLMVTVQAKDVVTEFPDTDQIIDEFYEDVTVLAGMKVIQGHADTKTFAPKAEVTRAQMAAIVYRLATGDASDARAHVYQDYQKFSDVKSTAWYAGYVGYCADAGYIAGYPDGTFKPDAKVTGYQALAMVLRAMGYNEPGHNFTGDGWKAETGATATQRGMLVNINKSIYAGTLSNYAPRELVAEIAFQAANPTHPMVQWTNAFGYQTTGLLWNNTHGNNSVTTATQNPSLGEMYYGLTYTEHVIVGNQATGETATVLASGIMDKTTSGDNAHPATISNAYAYAGQTDTTSYTGSTYTARAGNRFAGKTGLDLFGHNAGVWYDQRTSPSGYATYAIFDRAYLAKVVNSPIAKDATDDGSGNNEQLCDDDNVTEALLGIKAQAAGFTVNLDNSAGRGSKAHTSNSYGKITVGTAAKADAPTDPTREDGYGMYALISNNPYKTVDVIITLNAQVAQIVQKNTTSTVKTLTLGGTYEEDEGFGEEYDGIIKMNSITAGSETNLGSKVVAWKIIGTNDLNSNLPLYQLDKVTKVTTGTVQTYDGDGTITFTTGEKVEKSWLYEQIKSGYTDPVKEGGAFLAGVTYTLALDDDGRWLGVTTDPGAFLYGTFGDYKVGDLGTGTLDYTITGINWNGDKVVNQAVTSLRLPITGEAFADDGDAVDYPGTGVTLADGYNLLPITKKDQGAPDGGNRIQNGENTGFVVNGDGFVDGVDLGSAILMRNGDVTYDFSVTAQDAANGFKSVITGDANYGDLLLTDKTRFIVVTGSGTADLNAKVYTGLTEFLNGAEWVTLNVTATAKDRTYYKVDGDKFNKLDVTTHNGLITDVIMSIDDLTYYGADNLYLSVAADEGPGALGETNVKLAGTNPEVVRQFVYWKDGEKVTRFVDVTKNVAQPVASAWNPDGDAFFFRLTEVYQVNGVPVYMASVADAGPAADGYRCDFDLTYNYISVNNLSTAMFGNSGDPATKEILNVANAKVVDVEYNAITCTHDKIDSLTKLNAAVSGLDSYSGNIQVSIVNDGLNVSYIYVTTVPN